MKINKYFLLLGIAITSMAMTLTSCSRDDEITSLSYDRLFSALGLEARVQNQINVRLDWDEVSGADSYIVKVYESVDQEGEVGEATDKTQFVVAPGQDFLVREYTDITSNDIPFVVESLVGQTRYIFEVIAVDDDGNPSKGVCVEAKTGSEQTFKNVRDENIEAKSVVLEWNASDAEGCIIKVQAEGEEGYAVQHTVTAEEAAAKCATIEGLTGETNYTAYMKTESGKTRGTISFTTAIDLGDAIAVYPEDNLNKVLEEAEEGATIALFPGTFECTNEEGSQVKIKVNKSVSIKAVRPGDRPVIKGCIQLYEGASISLSQVILDGEGSDGTQTLEVRDAAECDKIIIDDCEIRNYVKGALYINVGATINEVTINNCIIHDVECSGGDLFDCRAGAIKVWNITENTIYNSAASRDFIRYDDKSANFPGVNSVITMKNNTLHNVGCGSSNNRLLYVRFANNKIYCLNNLISGFNNKRGYTNNTPAKIESLSGNWYYNCTNLTSASDNADATITIFDEAGSIVKKNPFKDADNGDFTIVDEDINYKKAGASRWIVAQ